MKDKASQLFDQVDDALSLGWDDDMQREMAMRFISLSPEMTRQWYNFLCAEATEQNRREVDAKMDQVKRVIANLTKSVEKTL